MTMFGGMLGCIGLHQAVGWGLSFLLLLNSSRALSVGRGIFQGANCGVPSIVAGERVLNKRIVGGKESVHGEWPWLATLQLFNKTSRGYNHLCGGTLIHPQWVISVAHCFESEWASYLTDDPSQWRVRLGEHHLLDDAEQHVDADVEKIIIPKERSAHQIWEYDIALMKLTEPVQMNRFVNLACVSEAADDFRVGQDCTTVGWGHTSEGGGKISPVLRHVSVPVIPPAYCVLSYAAVATQYKMRMDPDVLCAGAMSEGGKDACQYDSGGPLLCRKGSRYHVYGLVSTGLGCARKEYPGIYTRVTDHMDWIKETILNE